MHMFFLRTRKNDTKHWRKVALDRPRHVTFRDHHCLWEISQFLFAPHLGMKLQSTDSKDSRNPNSKFYEVEVRKLMVGGQGKYLREGL